MDSPLVVQTFRFERDQFELDFVMNGVGRTEHGQQPVHYRTEHGLNIYHFNLDTSRSWTETRPLAADSKSSYR